MDWGGRVEGSLRHYHIGFIDQGIVNHMDDAIRALDIRSEYVNPTVSPINLESWKWIEQKVLEKVVLVRKEGEPQYTH